MGATNHIQLVIFLTNLEYKLLQFDQPSPSSLETRKNQINFEKNHLSSLANDVTFEFRGRLAEDVEKQSTLNRFCEVKIIESELQITVNIKLGGYDV